MASYFGISGDFNSYFGTANTSATGGSSILGDYALIRNGSYKKLLNKYYNTKETGSTDKKTEETSEEKAGKNALLKTKDASESLYKAAEELKSADFSDLDAASKKVQSFVDSYNKTVEEAGKVDNKSVLRKTLWMIGSVKASSNLLKDAGIKIGDGNKLTFDSETFKKADPSTLKTLFSDANSVAGKVSGKANEIKNLSNSTIKAASGKSAYTSKGDYTSVNRSMMYDDLF